MGRPLEEKEIIYAHLVGIQDILTDFALWRANNMKQVKNPD